MLKKIFFPRQFSFEMIESVCIHHRQNDVHSKYLHYTHINLIRSNSNTTNTKIISSFFLFPNIVHRKSNEIVVKHLRISIMLVQIQVQELDQTVKLQHHPIIRLRHQPTEIHVYQNLIPIKQNMIVQQQSTQVLINLIHYTVRQHERIHHEL